MLLAVTGALTALAAAGCVYSDEPLITERDAVFPIAEGEYVACRKGSVAADCFVTAIRREQDGYRGYGYDAEHYAFIRENSRLRLAAIEGYDGRAYLVQQTAENRSDYGLALVLDGGVRIFVPSCDGMPSELRDTIQSGGLVELEAGDHVDSCKLDSLDSAKAFIAGWLDAGGAWSMEATYYTLSNE